MYQQVREELMQRPRRWLVTGAAGFIGSHLVEHLLALNQKVIGLDNFATGRRENLEQVQAAVSAKQWWRFRFIEGDIRSPADCRAACSSADLVLHQAALGSVPQSLADPVATHETNVSGFLNMLVASRDAGIERVVYAGSSATYGDHPAMPQVEDGIGRALSPYGLSKHVDELYAAIFARCYSLPAVGLRYFNVFGPRQDPNGAYAAVIPKWADAMIRDEPVWINGDGGTLRDFCFVDNVVQANLLAATVADPGALDRVYNIAFGEGTTLLQLFELMRAALQARYPRLRGLAPRHRDALPGDIRLSRADITRARDCLGYRPQFSVAAGLARTLDWYAAQPGAAPAPAIRVAARGIDLASPGAIAAENIAVENVEAQP